jgi:2-succinyl-6-hydroxy-2,4-cyclohexadiene-1-carboxylate synthase
MTLLRKGTSSSGVPLCAIHGLLGTPRSFAPLVSALDAFPGRVMGAILPGHGDPPSGPRGASFDEVVDALGRAWLKEPCHLLGYSMGGRIALALACRFPRQVRSVVVVGAHPGLSDPIERSARVAWEEDLARGLATDGMEAFVARWQALPIFETQSSLDAGTLEAQRHDRSSHVPEGIAWALRVLGTGAMPDLAARLREIEVPVTWVAGRLDVKFAALAVAAERLSPRIEASLVEAAGHNVVLEAPDALAHIVLRSIERRSS